MIQLLLRLFVIVLNELSELRNLMLTFATKFVTLYFNSIFHHFEFAYNIQILTELNVQKLNCVVVFQIMINKCVEERNRDKIGECILFY